MFAALYVVMAVPILRMELPPLVDYPNHLARMHVLIEHAHSQALQQYYEVHWRPLPNLAMDLTVPLLARIMPLDWAGKVFVLTLLALLPVGTALVHRAAAGRWSAWPLFAFVFLYGHLLLWGFLNYLCGLGLALMAFALWLALAHRASVLRIAIASASALVLFFAHLMACAIFGVLILGHEVGQLWREPALSTRRTLGRIIGVGLPFILPLAIMLASGLGGELGDIHYEGILRKLVLLWMFEGHPALDGVTTVVLVLLISVGLGTCTVTVAPALRGPLLALAVAYLLAPTILMTAWGVDERLPLAFMLVLAAGTVSTGPATRWVRVAMLAGLALFLGRVAAMEADGERANQAYPRLAAILDSVPPGGRLAVAFTSNEIGPTGLPINHIPTLAVIRRDAFVPTLATFETQQPVVLTPVAQALPGSANPGELWQALMAGEAGEVRLRRALAGYDALVVLDPLPFTVPPSPLLVPLGAEPNFALYRVVH